MILPQNIWAALNSEQGFDKLYIRNHLRLKNHIKAYNATVKQIRAYIPRYVPKQNEEAYRIKAWRPRGKGVDVPEKILMVFTDFEEVYFDYVREHETYKNAYIALMKDVNIYFPDYKHGKNWDSFNRNRTYRLTKKRKGN